MENDPSTILEAQYEILSSYRGGMGVVFVLRDHTTGDLLAAKTLHPHLRTARVLTRFQVEARAWIALGEHDNIVKARFYREIEDCPFLFMEFVDGADLDRILGIGGPLTLAQAVEFSRATLLGLHHAHTQRIRGRTAGIVHRDIKPANLLVRKDRVLKISDWGLAKILGATRLTSDDAVLGTLQYCAPEQLGSAVEADHRSDLFSCGVLLYEMLTGANPFPGETLGEIVVAVATAEPPPLVEVLPTCPPALSDLVARLLRKAPSDRPTGATDVLQTLDEISLDGRRNVACPGCGFALRSTDDPCPLCDLTWRRPARAAAGGGSDSGVRMRTQNQDFTMVPVPAGAPTPDGRAFEIMRSPVTNREFSVFVDELLYRPEHAEDFVDHWHGGAFPASLSEHPVVWVSFRDAAAFAAWAGLSLPTKSEWMWAARGPEARRFPWGEAFDSSRCNSREAGLGSTTPTGAFPDGASPCGSLDMLGNVWEWTDAWFEDGTRRSKTLCGGSWNTAVARVGVDRARNLFPDARNFETGFRCVRRMP